MRPDTRRSGGGEPPLHHLHLISNYIDNPIGKVPSQRRTQHDDEAVMKATNAMRMVEAGGMPLEQVWPWVMLELGPILARTMA